MSVPLPVFALFFVVFSMVSTILIAKIRADDKQRDAEGSKAPLPRANLAGARRTYLQRLREPGGYFLGIGSSALLSLGVCLVLSYIHSRPSPPQRRTYHIVDPLRGTEETRDLTEQELHEQYETVGSELHRIYTEHHQDAAP